MDLEIKPCRRDTILPSSPTPDHLKTYKLSCLDQMHLPVFIARVLFYRDDADLPFTNHEKLDHLKKSLPQVLTLYYPLAGRFAGNISTCVAVNCNDEGVVFVESSASGDLLNNIIYDPTPSEFTKFIPYNDDELKDHPLVIQATFFECGGLALGVGISHRIADAWSFFMFVNSWASASLGNNSNGIIVSPSFTCTTLFPPIDCVSFKPSYWDVNEDNISTERFVFSASNLSALRDKYTTVNSIVPTRIEALSAFIWDRFMASTTQQKDDPTKIYIIKHTINLRGKVVPALPDNSFGNIMWASNAIVSGGGDNTAAATTTTTTERIRQAIQNVGGDQETTLRELNETIKSIKNGEGGFIVEKKGIDEDEVVPLVFSSTCRFPIEKSDFGWGKPDWVGSANLPHKNVIYLLDSISGKGIEAWINLKSEDMVKFEVDEELLQYVTLVHDADICW